MTDLETQLASVLAERATGVVVTRDVDAVEREATIGRHAPRDRSTSRRRPLLAAAAFMAVVAGGAMVLDMQGGGSTASADWTPQVQSVSTTDRAAISEACAAELMALSSNNGINGTAEEVLGAIAAVDVRGGGGYVVYDSGLGCGAERADDGSFSVEYSVTGDKSTVLAQSLQQINSDVPAVQVLSVSSGVVGNERSYAMGVVSSEATAVVVSTRLGPVEATLAGQVWIAWWPASNALDDTVTATNDAGQTIAKASFSDLLPS